MIIPKDKVQHFIVGFTLSILGIFFLPLILLGFIFGVLKEIYDFKSGRGVPELNDIIATFIGAIIASILVILI
jgi:VanZ family protein